MNSRAGGWVGGWKAHATTLTLQRKYGVRVAATEDTHGLEADQNLTVDELRGDWKSLHTNAVVVSCIE